MTRVQLAKLQSLWEDAMEPAMEALERGGELLNPPLFLWSEGNRSQREPVASVEDAKLIIKAWTLADLIDPAASDWNAFGLEDAEFEWYDEEYRSITEVMDEEEANE